MYTKDIIQLENNNNNNINVINIISSTRIVLEF